MTSIFLQVIFRVNCQEFNPLHSIYTLAQSEGWLSNHNDTSISEAKVILFSDQANCFKPKDSFYRAMFLWLFFLWLIKNHFYIQNNRRKTRLDLQYDLLNMILICWNIDRMLSELNSIHVTKAMEISKHRRKQSVPFILTNSWILKMKKTLLVIFELRYFIS